MFEVVGNKEKLRPAMLLFTSKANEMMSDGLKEDLKKKKFNARGGMLKKLPGVDGDSISELFTGKLDNMAFATEETKDGYEIKVPILSGATSKPILGKILKMYLGKAKKHLEEFMEQIRYCSNCKDVTDEDKCPDCGNENLEKIEYEVQ